MKKRTLVSHVSHCLRLSSQSSFCCLISLHVENENKNEKAILSWTHVHLSSPWPFITDRSLCSYHTSFEPTEPCTSSLVSIQSPALVIIIFFIRTFTPFSLSLCTPGLSFPCLPLPPVVVSPPSTHPTTPHHSPSVRPSALCHSTRYLHSTCTNHVISILTFSIQFTFSIF